MKKLLILCATLLSFFILTSIPAFQKKFLYPFPYRTTIEDYSLRWNVDLFLAVSVMKVESNFQESAHSHSGAVGLMQIMPDTASWIANQLGESTINLKNLRQPDINIRYGTWYLAELLDEFNGNAILALAAYNAGRGNVHSWMQLYNWTFSFDDVEKIPFAETRDYVKRVLHCKQRYSQLYGSDSLVSSPIALHELRFARWKNLSL